MVSRTVYCLIPSEEILLTSYRELALELKHSEKLGTLWFVFIEAIVLSLPLPPIPPFLTRWKAGGSEYVLLYLFMVEEPMWILHFSVLSFLFFLPLLLLSSSFFLDLYILRDSPKFSDDPKREDSLGNRKLL